jgi:hypothetical protein
MSLHIRQATLQDLPSVLQLYAQPSMDNGKVLSLQAATSRRHCHRHYHHRRK